MVRHIVFWKIKASADGQNRAEIMETLEEKLLSLKRAIPEIHALEVGCNFNPSGAAWDMALIVTVEDEMALLRYQRHPAHQAVVEWVQKVAADRAVVDYELKS